MAPPRPLKRQKTNPEQEQSSIVPKRIPLPPTPEPQGSSDADQQNEQGKEQQRSSWYASWPRKATPVTQLARESISSASTTAVEVTTQVRDKALSITQKQRSPSLAMTLGKAKSNRSLPADATTTKVHAAPEPLTRRKSSAKTKKPSETPERAARKDEQKGDVVPVVTEAPGETASPAPANDATTTAGTEPDDAANASWLNWLAPSAAFSQQMKTVPSENNAQSPLPDNTTATEPGKELQAEPTTMDQLPQSVTDTSTNKRSWLQMWTPEPSTKSETPSIAPADTASKPEVVPSAEVASAKPTSKSKPESTSDASSVVMSEPPVLPHDGSKSSGWVFWSRDKKANTPSSSSDEARKGELAISNTPSETKPRRTSFSVKENEGPKTAVKKSASISEASNESGSRPSSVKEDSALKQDDNKREISATKGGKTVASAVARDPVESKESRPSSPLPSKRAGPELLLPPLHAVLRQEESPSLLQQLARMLYYTEQSEMKHLSLVQEPPKISSALAIGVHGYFPSPMLRSILGPPTGTSIKFADMAAEAIKRWTTKKGYECNVKTAALEGEGKIAERVELLWRLLLNWIDEIRKSDFVFVACHSQGVPVAIMLVAKLIQFGCLSTARVAICGIAAVSMGPFPELRSKWITGSAGELFEFYEPTSIVSAEYLAALDVVLKAGVKVTFVGAIDDQLVPLESSIFAPVTHPHIYRAVHIDGRVPASDFLSHLVGFILKLRNVGVQDHGLIHELSLPLAGSLYTGDGHSRIYEYGSIYDLAVSFALETNSIPNMALRSNRQAVTTATNPYILPFAMRGILEEDFVRNELQTEATELLKQFDEWRPTTKAFKDVKFRLEGIRSRL